MTPELTQLMQHPNVLDSKEAALKYQNDNRGMKSWQQTAYYIENGKLYDAKGREQQKQTVTLYNDKGEPKEFEGYNAYGLWDANAAAKKEGYINEQPKERWITRETTDGIKYRYKEVAGRKGNNPGQIASGTTEWRDHEFTGEQEWYDPDTGGWTKFDLGKGSDAYGSATVRKYLAGTLDLDRLAAKMADEKAEIQATMDEYAAQQTGGATGTSISNEPITKEYPNGTIGYLGSDGTYYNSIEGANSHGGGAVMQGGSFEDPSGSASSSTAGAAGAGVNWSVQGMMNDLAEANPTWSTERIVNQIKDQVGYNPKDDEAYNLFYSYHIPSTSPNTPPVTEEVTPEHEASTEGTSGTDQPPTKTWDNGTTGYLGNDGTYYNSIEGANSHGGGYVGDPSTGSGQEEVVEGVAGAAGIEDVGLPDEILNSAEFQALSPERQQELRDYYNLMVGASVEEKNALLALIDEARAYAEPKTKEEMRFVADAIASSVSQITGDYNVSADRLAKNIEDIATDLRTGAEKMTVEEEANLRRQQEQYEGALGNLASSGLISSTFRAKTEGAAMDIAESTSREQARQRQVRDRQMRDYARQLETQFGTVGAQNILQGLDPISGEAIEGGQNLQSYGVNQFLLGHGEATDIVGTEAERRAENVFGHAGATSPLNPTVNPLLDPLSP